MTGRLGWAIFGICGVALLSWAVAAETPSPCPAPSQTPTIAVEPFDTGLKYDLDRSEAEMIEIKGQPLPPHLKLRGLTVDHFGGWIEVKSQQARIGNGWCLSPVAVIAHIGFKDMTVYIDKKYHQGSCQRKAIVYHENKHVTINYQEMNAGLPRIEADLRAAYGAGHFPIYVADGEAGKKYVLDYFSYYFDQGRQQIGARMKTRNANLDNAEEYANISAMCPIW